MRVAVMKPIETGCEATAAGGLRAADAEALRFFADAADHPDLICPIRFAEPLAPQVAAERAGVAIDLERIRTAFEQLAAGAEIVLVEGAGGLLVPIAPGFAMADLARTLDLPVLVVVGSKLGAINHAMLTCEVARGRGLALVGYAVNFPTPASDIAAATNVAILRELLGPPLGVFPWQADAALLTGANRDRLAALGREQVDLDRLLGSTAS